MHFFVVYNLRKDATYALSQCSGMVIDEHYVKISYCKSGGLKKGSQAPAVMNPYGLSHSITFNAYFTPNYYFYFIIIIVIV